MVCGQSFNLNTLPPKIQPCYENSPILWHKADEHVTCTLKSCLMPGMCRGGAGRVSCWQCVHGKTQLWALLLCHLAWAVWIMSRMNSAQHTAWVPSSCTWELGCTAKVCAGCGRVGGHQTSAVLLCQAELPAPSTSSWAGKHPTTRRSHLAVVSAIGVSSSSSAFLEHLTLCCWLVDSIHGDKWDEVPGSW